MTAQGVLVNGSIGPLLVAPPALYGSGAPLSTLKGILGQEYFDTSTTPRTAYVWDGVMWQTDAGSGSGSFTTLTVTGQSTLGNTNIVGTTNINATGSAATTIGNASSTTTTGPLTVVGATNINTSSNNPTNIGIAPGSGVVNIGNVAGGTAFSGLLTLDSSLILNGPGTQLRVQGGSATDFIGSSTLAAGTVTIANTNIAATDRIFISRTSANASTTLGEFSYTISAGASFTVTSLILGTPGSTQTGDLSSFVYFIVREV